MAMVIPAKFKPITQYIRRAEKLDKAPEPEAPVVGYYCRLFAASQVLRSHDGTEESTAFLTSLLQRLEEDKSKGVGDFSEEEGKKMCMDCAMKAFNEADEEDRSGSAGLGTARIFYTAGVYFDVMRQFVPEGTTDEEMDRQRIYCKWKAAQIVKAVKEGKTPAPGGVNEQHADKPTAEVSEETGDAPTSAPTPAAEDGGEYKSSDLLAGNIPGAPISAPIVDAPLHTYDHPSTGGTSGGDPLHPSGVPASAQNSHVPYSSPASAPHATAPYVAPVRAPYAPPATQRVVERPRTPVPSESGARRVGGEGKPQEGDLADAMEHCRYALRALEHKNVELAVEQLEGALRQIT